MGSLVLAIDGFKFRSEFFSRTNFRGNEWRLRFRRTGYGVKRCMLIKKIRKNRFKLQEIFMKRSGR